jgi:glycosyltransferase involved in cell wall biosynthesis
LIELGGREPARTILVNPHGVDGQRFPFRERRPRAADAPLELLSISRIEPKKGFLALADAIQRVAAAGHQVRVHMVGDKDPLSKGSLEYAERLERRIQEHGIQASFVWHGFLRQEQMGPVLERAHAFVAPYVETASGDKDGIPTAILEAMASGLGVVCTHAGSIAEVIDHQREGLVVAQDDAKALAKALIRLIEDPQLPITLGRQARARFDAEFDIGVTERRLHQRIEEVLKKRRKSKPTSSR